jgi:hypothetical protein
MLASPTSSFELLASHGEKTNKSKKIGEHHNKIFFQNVLTNNSDESNCWGHLAFDVLCVQFRKYFMQKVGRRWCDKITIRAHPLAPLSDAFVKARAGA